MRYRLAAAAAAAVAALGISGVALATSAGATTTTVTASTAVTNHPDTTSSSGSGTACTPSPGGPVWAKDAYTSTLAAVQTAAGTWRVTLQDNGSFAGFADPNSCNALVSKGSLLGLYTVTVKSSTAPVAADLKPSYSGAVSSTQMVEDFFGGAIAASDVAGGDYFFVYQGGNYVQTTSSLYGDVTAYVPPQVKVPNVVGKRVNPAITTLKAAGFVVGVPPRQAKYTYVVTAESPKAGTSAAQGSTVTLTIKRI